MGKRFAIVIGVAVAGVMALGAQPAAAGPADVVKYDTKLTLGLHVHQRFYYWLRAEGTECELGRRVVLFLRRPGADRKLGTDRSGPDRFGPHRLYGGVIIAKEHRVTVVYAKVRREVHDEFVCGRDRSQLHDDRPR